MKKYLLALPLLVAFGCNSSDADDESGHEEVTYYQHIAPLYAEKCVKCHQDGGIAPMALDNFDDAKRFGPASKAATESGQMPPYLVTTDGSCGDFHEPRSLSDEEIHLIADWVDADMPAGEEEDVPKPAELPKLEGEMLTLSTPEFFPEIVGDELSKFDEYRCFLLDPEFSEETFLTGYEVLPGNEAIVHHVVMFPVDLDSESDMGDGTTNGELITAYDDDSPDRDGWPCFGAAGDGVGILGVPVTWAPGMGAVKYPNESGVHVPAGTKFVVQMHYNMSTKELEGQKDQTDIKLSTSQQVGRVAFFDLPDALLESLFSEEPDVIPAGEELYEYSFDIDYDDIIQDTGYLELAGVFPHMHETGRTLKLEIVRDKDEMCQAEVTSWDFNWQLFYFYDQPVPLQEGDKLRVTCGFNTEGLEDDVLPGWGTENEMCLAGLMLSIPLEAP